MLTKKLREQRANIYQQMQDVLDAAEAENRDLSGEERASYEAMEADLDSLGSRIERQERMDQLANGMRGTAAEPPAEIHAASEGDDETEYTEAFADFLRHGMADVSAEHRALLQARFQTAPQNAAGVGSGSAGGYTVPEGFRQVMIETMKAFGPMLTEAEVIYTETGNPMPWPTNDDTANVGAILAENTQVTEQDVTFGTGLIEAYMYTSKLVRVSLQFLQDSTASEQWLARKLGERIGRILNQHLTTGGGTTLPDGIVTSATVGATGTGSFATTKGISYDDLVDLQESLDPAYGSHPNCKWMLHQSVRKAVRKLKDSTGLPIWQPSVQAGVPDTLLGRPVLINNDMATLAASSKSIGYGNIRGAYVARNSARPALLRLTERYADYLQVGFLAFERWDGTLQDAGAFKIFQTTATD